MMSCKEATELMSQAQDRELSLSERTALKVHLALCKGCRNFDTQIDFIRRAFQRLAKGEAPLDEGDH